MEASNFWEMWKAISTSAGVVLIPIVVAFIANLYSKSLKDAELQVKYLELAVKILEQQPNEHNSDIREWAVFLINSNSRIPLPSSTQKALIETTPFPFTTITNIGIDPEIFQRLATDLGVTQSALKTFMDILEQQNVPIEQLDSKLREIAESYKSFKSRLEFMSKNELLAMREEAREALEKGDFSRANTLLSETADKETWKAAESYLELAQVYSVQKLLQEADRVYKKAIYLTEGLTGDDRSREIQALEAYAGFLREHGSVKDAEAIEQRIGLRK